MTKASAQDLQSIPGVGPSLARDLEDLGLREVADLRGRDPEQMYRTLCDMRGAKIDRCVLYVFRCAVYYAERCQHDPELLKWWNWKDGRRQPRRRCGNAAPIAKRAPIEAGSEHNHSAALRSARNGRLGGLRSGGL